MTMYTHALCTSTPRIAHMGNLANNYLSVNVNSGIMDCSELWNITTALSVLNKW